MTPELTYAPREPRPRRGRRITAGKLTGQKPALKMKEVWAIRIRLQLAHKARELALFNLAIDSKLRGCDLVRLKVEDIAAAGEVKARAVIIRKKTGRPVQFEITEQTRIAVATLIRIRDLGYRFPISKPTGLITASIDQTICEARSSWGEVHRFKPGDLRHALTAAHEGSPHLSENRQPPGCATLARAYEAREHSPVPWCRGR